MSETIRHQLMVLNNYRDLVDSTANHELSREYYYIVGLLEGLAYYDRDAPYEAVREQDKQEVMWLYQMLNHLEHDRTPAGGNE